MAAIAKLRASHPWVLTSLHGYETSWIRPDAIAGLTLLAIAIPEQLATSRLAAMPPITGLYAFIAGTVMFALLGSNPHLSVGADSTTAPLFAAAVGGIATAGSSRYVDLVGILAVMVGLFVVLVGIARLGWIAEFLSVPIITGFLAGIAVVIVIHQLPDLFGISSATGSNLHRIRYSFGHLGSANGWAVGIGLVVFATIIGLERIDRRLPGALIGMVGSTVVVAALDLKSHGVAVLGTVAHKAPHFGLEGVSWTALGKLAPIAGLVALIVVSQSAATTRAFSESGSYDVDVNRDFVGVGAGSLLAGLSGSFPVNASPPRTAVVESASGRTQLAGLGAATAVVVLIPASGLLKDVPLAALAGTLLYVAVRLFRVRDLISIGRFSLVELGLALVTLLTVTLVGVEQGIGVAVGLAILERTRRTARHNLHVLGRVVGTTSWTLVHSDERTEQVDGVLVVLFATPLWYANADLFRAQFLSTLSETGRPIKLVVLDAIGMADIDYTGARALAEVLDHLQKSNIALYIGRGSQNVRESLVRSGLMARIGEDHWYPVVDQAVSDFAPGLPGAAG
ncbi:MAG TPA: SulP family inorganic anion transporter [Acidimicrobiales bacterium]